MMFFQRPVTQGHFVRKQQVSLAGRSAFQEMQRWAIAHLAQIRGLEDLAAHMHLSTRHLARLFQQEMQIQPAHGWSRRASATRGLCWMPVSCRSKRSRRPAVITVPM